MEDANEIQESLSRSYGTPDIDEADLEAGQDNTCRIMDFFFYTLSWYWLISEVICAKPSGFFITITHEEEMGISDSLYM